MSRSVEITSPKQGVTNLWKLELLGIATLDDFTKRLKSFAISLQYRNLDLQIKILLPSY
jgi:hypothetical protein